MERYVNFGGDRDIVAFDLAADAIRVEFTCGTIYLYTSHTLGMETINKIKDIATRGGKLSRHILHELKNSYDMRIVEYPKG